MLPGAGVFGTAGKVKRFPHAEHLYLRALAVPVKRLPQFAQATTMTAPPEGRRQTNLWPSAGQLPDGVARSL